MNVVFAILDQNLATNFDCQRFEKKLDHGRNDSFRILELRHILQNPRRGQ